MNRYVFGVNSHFLLCLTIPFPLENGIKKVVFRIFSIIWYLLGYNCCSWAIKNPKYNMTMLLIFLPNKSQFDNAKYQSDEKVIFLLTDVNLLPFHSSVPMNMVITALNILTIMLLIFMPNENVFVIAE